MLRSVFLGTVRDRNRKSVGARERIKQKVQNVQLNPVIYG